MSIIETSNIVIIPHTPEDRAERNEIHNDNEIRYVKIEKDQN